MNNGLYIKGKNYSGQSTDYHGMLLEVLELEYQALPIKRIILSHSEWFDPTLNVRIQIHSRYNIVDVN